LRVNSEGGEEVIEGSTVEGSSELGRYSSEREVDVDEFEDLGGSSRDRSEGESDG